MMIPLGVGLLKGLPYEENKKAYWFVILGITYSSSIGGMGTLVGSPPNAIVSSNLHITFQEWLWYGMPVVAGLLPLTIIFLYFFFRPNLKNAMISPKGEQTHQVTTTLGKNSGQRLLYSSLQHSSGCSPLRSTQFSQACLAWRK